MTAHVDALIVNYGTGDLTRRAAQCVHGPDVHVWVYDNSGELVGQRVPHVEEVLGDGTNTYFAAGNNALLVQCDGPYILLLNPDVELTYTGLQELAAFLQAHPEAWGVAPRLLNQDGSDQHYLHRLPDTASLLADRLPPLRRVLRRRYARYVSEDVDLRAEQVVVQPPAACLLLRRDRLEGELFDPDYRLFFNDTDLARRLNAKGTCWYVPTVTAQHLRGESFRRLKPRAGYAMAREYDRTLLVYARRNLRHWWLLVPVVLARRAASHVVDAVRVRR